MLRTDNARVAADYLEKAYIILMNSLGEYDPKTKEVGELAKKVEEMQQNNPDEYDDEGEDEEP